MEVLKGMALMLLLQFFALFTVAAVRVYRRRERKSSLHGTQDLPERVVCVLKKGT